MEALPKDVLKKYIPHRILHQGSLYLALDGVDDVLKINVTVTKVNKLIKDDQPFILPTGSRGYEITHKANITTLTKEEWIVEKQSGFGLQ